MHIRTFRAASLQDALAEIRDQMGPEASVLHTRQVRDGWMGWLGRTYVEVTAGLRDIHDQPPLVPLESDRPTAGSLDTRSPSATPHHGLTVKGGATPAGGAAAGNAVPYNTVAPIPLGDALGSVLPPQVQYYRQALMQAGVLPEAVDRWIESTTSFTANLVDTDGQPWLEHLRQSVARELKFGGAIRTQPGDRRIVALVGPTGVGKTTTIAKLAAGFRIEARRRVGLVTIDTFRIAAVQQLKAYAEIMDLPMEVVEKPEQMQDALDRLGDVDLVLIDTAGRSPHSDARIDQLVELLRTAQPDETHLVISATSSAPTVQAVLTGFAPVRPTAAILTKLDEASHTAGILSAIGSTEALPSIPMSYLTNGQQVPDDISTAEAEVVLNRLLPARVALTPMEAA